MNVKKAIYIFFCAILGLILSFIAHAVLEMMIINLLVSDFQTYGLGLSWETWFIIHAALTPILVLAGIAFGVWLGFCWYRIVYEEGKGGFMKNVLNDHKGLENGK